MFDLGTSYSSAGLNIQREINVARPLDSIPIFTTINTIIPPTTDRDVLSFSANNQN
jgi:hypothetical protein